MHASPIQPASLARNKPRPAHWRWFTIGDMVIVVVLCGLGMALARGATHVDTSWESYPAPMLEKIALGLTFGCSLAMPLVLGLQWLFRKRSDPLSFGEWLGLTPICAAVLCFLFAPIGGGVLSLVFILTLWPALQSFIALCGVAYVVACLVNAERRAKLAWTDVLACVTCCLMAPLLWYEVALFPGF